MKSPLAILLANLESFCVEKMRGYVIIILKMPAIRMARSAAWMSARVIAAMNE